MTLLSFIALTCVAVIATVLLSTLALIQMQERRQLQRANHVRNHGILEAAAS